MGGNKWVTTTLGTLLSCSNGKSSPERSNDLPYPVYDTALVRFALAFWNRA